MSSIRVKAVCVFHHAGAILVTIAFDPASGLSYARPVGGGVEVGERAAETVRREVREELGAEMSEPVLLGVIENVFQLGREVVHEVLFVFDARLIDASLYERTDLHVRESSGENPARWLSLEALRDGPLRLYPEEIVTLVERVSG